ncbi:MAG TPA: PrsW family glutamic-type intramembrane protease [Candidatus Saccharimonadales bacterium]|nr:PrsW family glutamic-type intramembrane protease [Candidatus Saccharimonadales bacterium]
MFINPVILAQIGVAWLFIRYLRQHDAGSKEPIRALLIAGIFGALATVGAFFLERWVLPDSLVTNPSSLLAPHLFDDSLLVGLIEEGLKSLPLAIFIYKRPYFNELSDGIIYFGIAGMAFGLIENIGYDLSFGAVTGFFRILAGPYMHAGLCALFGFMLAQRKVMKINPIFVPLAFMAAVSLHGVYDFGIFYKHPVPMFISLGITALVNIGVFLLFKYSRRIDSKLGLSAAGANYYCPHCGRPNPQRFLFCTYCGHKA